MRVHANDKIFRMVKLVGGFAVLLLIHFAASCGGDSEQRAGADAGPADAGVSDSGVSDGFGEGMHWLVVLSDDIQLDRLSDSATLWGVPYSESPGVDLSEAVRLYDGEVYGFADYGHADESPRISGGGGWASFRDESAPDWYIVPIDGSSAPLPVDGQVHWAPTTEHYFIGDGSGGALYDASTGQELVSTTWSIPPVEVIWAEDGSALLVRRYESGAGGSALDLLTVEGATHSLVTSESVNGMGLSSDGSRVMYRLGDRAWVANADGTNAMDVADASAGMEIAPTLDKGIVCAATSCVILDFGGTTTAVSVPLSPGETLWAQDGSTVFRHDFNTNELVAIDASSGALTSLGTYLTVNAQPSPTGRWILASNNYDGPWEAVPSEGTEPVAITDSDGVGIEIVLWNGDGELTWIGMNTSEVLQTGGQTLEASNVQAALIGISYAEARMKMEELKNSGWVVATFWTGYGSQGVRVDKVVFVDADVESIGMGDGVVDKNTIVVEVFSAQTTRAALREFPPGTLASHGSIAAPAWAAE